MTPDAIGHTFWMLPPNRSAFSKPIGFMEHRWGDRVGVDIPVRLTAFPFVRREGQLANVSASGALIRGDGIEFRVLSRIEVLILPMREKDKVSRIQAYITRTLQDGIGVAWCESAPRAIMDLLRFQRERMSN
jgi:hypothetical protein